jgi:hypothetical protein
LIVSLSGWGYGKSCLFEIRITPPVGHRNIFVRSR